MEGKTGDSFIYESAKLQGRIAGLSYVVNPDGLKKTLIDGSIK